MNRAINLLRGSGLYLILLLFSLSAAASDRFSLGGKAIQGGLLFGKTEPGTRVAVAGEPVQVSAAGDFLVGLQRDEKSPVQLRLSYVDGSVEDAEIAVQRRDYRIQRINGLAKRKVEPNAEDLKRIRTEQQLVNQARRRDDPRTDYLDGFIWPVQGPVSGVYGSQRILNGKPRRPHYGVDVAVPTGTPIRAPAAGIVTLAHPDMFFSGGTVIIDHGHGLSSTVMHLSEVLVDVGQPVQQGDVVAKSGMTGRATGPHLHWGLNLFKRRLDPALLVPPMPKPAG